MRRAYFRCSNREAGEARSRDQRNLSKSRHSRVVGVAEAWRKSGADDVFDGRARVSFRDWLEARILLQLGQEPSPDFGAGESGSQANDHAGLSSEEIGLYFDKKSIDDNRL